MVRSSGLRKVVVIVGPTASGKSDVALALARLLPAEILSADSRQVFKHLTIGTAKPSADILREIPHHFIDVLSPDQEFNAGEFGEKGRAVIEEIFGRNRLPIVVGGSGLYVQSLIDGFFEGPGADREFREILDKNVREGKLPELLEELRRVDPSAAAAIDPTKPRRVIRALEVFHLTGKPLSEWHQHRVEINFEPLMFGLLWDRKELYARIDARCDSMLAQGLVQEAESIARMGYSPALNSLNTVGYAEAFRFLRGEISREEMERLFKQNSRRYAKRQMTWFRRDERIRWIPMSGVTDVSSAAASIAAQIAFVAP